MSAELTGELLDRDLVERHEALMTQFARGACAMCVALYEIRKGETYHARGYDSWTGFVESVGLSKTNAQRYANCGPVLRALIAAGEGDLVRHPDMLRPIAGMMSTRKPETNERSAQRQLGIIRNAAYWAKRQQVPLDEKMIADAARRVGWEPDRSKRKKDDGPKTPEQLRADMREHIALAIGVIVDYRRGGFELEREIGITQIAGFDTLREILNDAKDSEI